VFLFLLGLFLHLSTAGDKVSWETTNMEQPFARSHLSGLSHSQWCTHV